MLDTPKHLPFEEAINFHKQKQNFLIKTETWRELQKGAHARAFTVAGAAKDELLSDFFQSIRTMQEEGKGLRHFQKDFDAIVEKHGWDYKGSRGWRSTVIYKTNVTTAWQAGRYKQQLAVSDTRPFWRYRHGGSKTPRQSHKNWDGLILRADDPWWITHYPPNGWGCSCYVQTLSQKDLDREGLTVGSAPTKPGDTTGIGEGWDYSVGEAAWGRPWPHEDESRVSLTPQTKDLDSRPIAIPRDPPVAPLGPHVGSPTELRAHLKSVLGEEPTLHQVDLPGLRMPVLIDADWLTEHFLRNAKSPEKLKEALSRGRYAALAPSVLSDPFEVWADFEQYHNGQVALKMRFLKLIDTGEDSPLLAVADVVGGQVRLLTYFAGHKVDYLLKQRKGKLLYGRN